MGKQWKQWQTLFSWAPESLCTVTEDLKLKGTCSLEEKLWPTSAAAAAAKSRQSCLTLCDPIDGSPPGSCPWDFPGKNTGVGCHFLLQCRKGKVKSLSRVRLFVTPWTIAYQAPPSMGFPRQEYWSGLPLPSLMTDLDSLVKNRDITLSTRSI